MPRPCKKRKVCSNPGKKMFAPRGMITKETIQLNVDEYEALRLIDVEGLTQEGCAASMDVARSTVQSIYASARHKLSRALVENCAIVVEGGEYELCSGPEGCCDQSTCCRSTCTNK
jgi:predicted DNA-binding protein (UPF0251 family)